ncbi:Protein of unknown function (DUF2891) [Chitinophaga skermanii]|uniref:DUF2891 family protein n=1 Tax=Chitinophaga skermanii TaxID=331697 RepID=A0A327QA69_9BACT|nr:DUF2891 domain-containing protein [Chitinophaga skermanii]RAI98706.1 Protein of unknown function (DUF2891) [Chitinophaga skermanii]
MKRNSLFRYTIGVAMLMASHTAMAQKPMYEAKNGGLTLTTEGAAHLSTLPLKCMQQPYPYKTGIVYSDSSLLVAPSNYHPAFYGCFDWHSSVHGHWMLVKLLKTFPNLPQAKLIRQKLAENLTAANIRKEIQIFHNRENRGFERIYGWSWLLQLETELRTWEDPLGEELADNVQPLANLFSTSYIAFLKNLAYPIRVGEHTNLAFGLSLAWDYAQEAYDEPLSNAIKAAAMRFYAKDVNAPVTYEPGGYDFLSPSLEEADLMWRILPAADYKVWLKKFLPGLFQQNITIFEIAEVRDRTDGKLVHLDGLNLSRAWCLFNIAEHTGAQAPAIRALAVKHLEAAFPNVVSGNYAGDHWLASFAVYALTASKNSK